MLDWREVYAEDDSIAISLTLCQEILCWLGKELGVYEEDTSRRIRQNQEGKRLSEEDVNQVRTESNQSPQSQGTLQALCIAFGRQRLCFRLTNVYVEPTFSRELIPEGRPSQAHSLFFTCCRKTDRNTFNSVHPKNLKACDRWGACRWLDSSWLRRCAKAHASAIEPEGASAKLIES